MPSNPNPTRNDVRTAHPIAELLACPPEAGKLLSAATETVLFSPGTVVFAQSSSCKGLYLVAVGQLLRQAERLEKQVTLGTARPGDLVELSAALGDGHHTYSLIGQTSGSLLLLPMAALERAFEAYPPMRMRLLEELAREVSRGYRSCLIAFDLRRRRSPARLSPI